SYEIDHLDLTSLEFDHADIFANLDAINAENRNLMNKLTSGVINSSDYPAILELRDEMTTAIHMLYLEHDGSDDDKCPKILSSSEKGTLFELRGRKFETNVVGLHNILNLSSIIIFALKEGFSHEEIQSSIRDLQMVRRRQELRGYYKDVPVIDDFAH